MDNLGALVGEPTSKILVVAGLIFLGFAIVGKFSGKFELGPTSRVVGGVLGITFVFLGLRMPQTVERIEATALTPTVATIASIPTIETAVTSTLLPVPTIAPTVIPSSTPSIIPLPITRERISFDLGSASDSFVVNLEAGQSKGYILNITAGQQMYITIPNQVRLLMLDTWDNKMETNWVDTGHWIVTIPQTGDYTVVLYGEGQTFVTIYIPPL